MAFGTSTSTSSTTTPARQRKKKMVDPNAFKIITRVTTLPYESLQGKTRERLGAVHSVVVAMQSTLAAKKGFVGPHVTITSQGNTLPATMVLDKHVKDDAAIVSRGWDERGMQLCEMLREGEEITITPGCPSLFAEDVFLSVLSGVGAEAVPGLTHHLQEQLVLSGLVLQRGMSVVIHYLTQDVMLRVEDVTMLGLEVETKTPFRCLPQTRICVSTEEEKVNIAHPEVTFEDIGGYEKEIESICRHVAALFSSDASKTNIPRGILISGPSGSGKTLIGRALKAKYGKKFLPVSIEEVKSKYVGESEQNLTRFFSEAAKRSPCLLFLDDLDLLCGSRDKGGSGGTGVVTALLHLMDGVTAPAEGVMVLATATRPQNLDAALRRPGRLSLDVHLGAPGPQDRWIILQNLLKGIPSDIEEDELSSLASKTHGYLGGDLRSVVVAAATEAGSGTLSKTHLEEAFAHTRPALVKDSVASSSGIKLSHISGYAALKSRLHEAVSLTLKHASVFKNCGFSAPTRFLLFGPPGCGKTALISAIAAEFHLNIIPIKRSTVLGKYFGESEQNLTRIFHQASESAPCIIHFENFEGLAGGRKGSSGGSDAESRVINHLKVQLDGIVRCDGVFIFAETNRPDLLNKDVIRPGRFHEYHYVKLPSAEDRQQLLKDHLSSLSTGAQVTMDSLVKQTEQMTVAEILQICEETGASPYPSPSASTSIEEVVEMAVPNTSLRLLHKYENFAKVYCSDA